MNALLLAPVLQVALGGALGAALRYGVVQAVSRSFGGAIPLGTGVVNLVGSFAMGLVAVWVLQRVGDARFAPLIITGLLGGFTTFSAFSLDAVLLWDQGREGMAAIYVFGSVFGSVASLLAGMVLMRAVLA